MTLTRAYVICAVCGDAIESYPYIAWAVGKYDDDARRKAQAHYELAHSEIEWPETRTYVEER